MSEATIYTRKSQYGGMDVSEAQRVKHLFADLNVMIEKRLELGGVGTSPASNTQ